ncbi:hypothetical protein D3C72_1968760 [compost metagenome]
MCPRDEIAQLCKEHIVIFHTIQAYGSVIIQFITCFYPPSTDGLIKVFIDITYFDSPIFRLIIDIGIVTIESFLILIVIQIQSIVQFFIYTDIKITIAL